ncbi:hypothetical protein [Hymenobacter jeollabukensis]|uniref:Uncharacterized protein n=1 Tax=Hymenobacter jeollabukensis TaxID=2025313 RepID=A0A5R8WJJ3_9BACT|nr:hypothetical protein [Hymenobacter jeollabukensis]TLM89099.1 hypothetical protein FDY95_21250 [Hymenobacter jeollabukensis]
MKRPKKRWAWKARHKCPNFKNYWQRGDDVGWVHREEENRHRTLTRKALYRIGQGADESHVVFPYYHHHCIIWW